LAIQCQEKDRVEAAATLSKNLLKLWYHKRVDKSSVVRSILHHTCPSLTFCTIQDDDSDGDGNVPRPATASQEASPRTPSHTSSVIHIASDEESDKSKEEKIKKMRE